MKTRFARFSLLLLLLLMSGCATVARSDYAGDKIYPDIQSAMQHTAPVVQMTPGSSLVVKISTDSPLLASPSANGRFERIALKGRKGESFFISVASICDCLGFRKWVVVPFVYLFDPAGTLMAQEAVTRSQSKVLFGKFPADGDYVLMLVADRDSEGQNLGWLANEMYLPLNFTSHPTGKVSVVWQENVAPAPSAASGE